MELPKRKPNRLKDYDYSLNGRYFITICTKNGECLLGEMVGDGVLDVPNMQLSKSGVIVENQIQLTNKIYQHINVEKYIIMPNHLHFIIIMNNADVPTKNSTKISTASGIPTTQSPTNAIIPSFVSTFKRYTNKNAGFTIWQRSFHDHIIRNEKEYQKIWEYIDSNQLKWFDDCYHTN